MTKTASDNHVGVDWIGVWQCMIATAIHNQMSGEHGPPLTPVKETASTELLICSSLSSSLYSPDPRDLIESTEDYIWQESLERNQDPTHESGNVQPDEYNNHRPFALNPPGNPEQT